MIGATTEIKKSAELDDQHKGSGLPTRDRAIWCICILAIVVGCLVRFVNLDLKVATFDEQVTIRQVGGYLDDKQLPQVLDCYVPASKVMSASPLASHSTVYDTFEAIRQQTTFNPPIYFLLARGWTECINPHSACTRTLSAVISLLEIPCFYFLCTELFASPLAAIIITALSTLSPYHLQLAQFARPYSLWTVLTLLSSALLLRASRKGSRKLWLFYAFASLLNLYTHISALLVMLSHLIYACFEKAENRRFKIAPLLGAMIVPLLLFVPWAFQINEHFAGQCGGLNWFIGNGKAIILLSKWLDNALAVFFDIYSTSVPMHQLLIRPAFVLEVLAVSYFVLRAPKRVLTFVLTMFGTTLLFLAVPDLLLGGDRTGETRYMMPCALALQCMVGFTIFALCTSPKKPVSRAGMGALLLTVAALIISCCSVVQSRALWHYWGLCEIDAASKINQCKKPIVISSHTDHNERICLSMLASQLRPDVLIAFSSTDKLMPIPDDVTDVFLWKPHPSDIQQLSGRGQYEVRPVKVEQFDWLAKVIKTEAPAKADKSVLPVSR